MASPTLGSEPVDTNPTDPEQTTLNAAGPPRRWASGLLRIAAAGVGGLATYFSYAPSTTWWSAILGIALLGLAVHGQRLRVAVGLGTLFGLAMFLPLLAWSSIYVGAAPWVALTAVEALLVAPSAALAAAASRRLPAWPVWAAAAWVAGEALRQRFPFGGFPWGGLAFSQPDGPLLPVAALTGAAGLSFVTALAGFALAELLRRWRPHRRQIPWAPAILVLIPFVAGLGGRLVMVDPSDAPQRIIAVVQGNVPEPGLDFNAKRRAVTDMHAQRTFELAEAVRAGTVPQPDLVIWPENASDIDPYVNTDAAEVISGAAREIGVPILVGAVVGTDEPGRLLNRGIVWDPVTGPGAVYDKRHPVPFGEYMPMRSFFRIFSDKVDLLRSEFVPGRSVGNLDIAGVNVGDVICFEVVYDGLVRDVVNGGAQVLVVQTNNATFGWTNETYQQQAMSRVRAVEHGRAVLVAATSGISAVIRPDGSIESSVPLFTPGYLVPSVPLIVTRTPGTVLGASTELLLTLATPLALLAAWGISRRTRRNAAA